MKKETLAVHDLHVFLKEIIQPLVKDTKQMLNGRDVEIILQRPRELLCNFLIAVLESVGTGLEFTIAYDPNGRDGAILNLSAGHEGEYLWMEHVFVPGTTVGSPTEAILSAIHTKVDKNSDYGKGLHLVVFSDKGGIIDNEKIRDEIRKMPNYKYYCTYIIGHNNLERHDYGISVITDKLRLYNVIINDNWDDWRVDYLGTVDEL